MSTSSPVQDGRYLLLADLGRGGMASVYRAFDRVDQRLVALKVTRERASSGPGHPLTAEFDVWSRLQHPNIVRAFGFGVARSGPIAAGAPYLVLEHVRGRPAHRALVPGTTDASTVEQVGVQVLRGLEHLHGAGLVHRDLKPGNVLVERRGPAGLRVKLTDFGLSERSGLTGTPGTISGSLPYVAPETILGGRVDGRADLYALGILLFRLTTGSLPCASRDAEGWVRWHLTGESADPRRYRPQLPERLARFIRRLTARAPAERPAGAREALRLLGASGRPVRAPQPPLARGLRARLRLDLDAVRLGAVRVARLTACRRSRTELVRELRVRCQAHGVEFHALRASAGEPCGGLAGAIFCMLLGRGARAPALAGRHELARWLPLRLVAGVPVWDACRAAEPRSPVAERRGGAARRLAEFVLDCAAVRPIVLDATRPLGDDPLFDAFARHVEALTQTSDAPDPERGGLLLLLPRGAPLRPATAPGSSAPG